MEQRPLRLGDIVDDYCPRERRITNHAVVALIGDEIRQTRCATCDGEHVYKQARMPKRVTVLKDGTAVVDSAQSDNGQGQLVARAAAAKDGPEPAADGESREASKAAPADAPASDDAGPTGNEPARDGDGWLAHRPLIRASLPRTEGEPPAPRPIPEFTMHRQAYGRPFRQGHGRPGGNGQAQSGFGQYGHQGNPGNHGNQGNPVNQGNGQPRPAGSRRRRRRGGRPKPPS